MTIKVVTFNRRHLDVIEPQEGQRVSDIPRDKISTLEAGWSFTVLDEDARVLMCAGALPDKHGVWWGWALLSVLARSRMLALTRAILHILRDTSSSTVRMAVEPACKARHRWAAMLGFEPLRDTIRIGNATFNVYERSTRLGS